MTKLFERNGDFCGYSIKKTDSGFMIDFWSIMQGETNGDKYLYKFDNIFTPNTDLELSWNDWYTNGEMLAYVVRKQNTMLKAYGAETTVKCLSRGLKVA